MVCLGEDIAGHSCGNAHVWGAMGRITESFLTEEKVRCIAQTDSALAARTSSLTEEAAPNSSVEAGVPHSEHKTHSRPLYRAGAVHAFFGIHMLFVVAGWVRTR